MGKLYLFLIGGTGVRVMRSLIMLLASGVRINASKIIPIIIDPDQGAADSTKMTVVINSYRAVRSQLNASNNTFFISDIADPIIIPIPNTNNQNFGGCINMNGLVNPNTGNFNANYALTSMLYSQKNLSSGLSVGFKGNPNMGSVILNQIFSSQSFINSIADFAQGDRIFVVSSIFGGTGASGFPLLVKNLRINNQAYQSSALLMQAPIGAISVLPYFAVKTGDGEEIDSSTFMLKTRAALTYYLNNLKEVNTLYYIADTTASTYAYSVGGTTQENNAHVVEMISALSIVDFMKMPNNQFVTTNGKAQNTVYKEFGLVKDSHQLIFNNFDPVTNKIIKAPMTQFFLLSKYMQEKLKKSIERQETWVKSLMIDELFIDSNFNIALSSVCDEYMKWLGEMSKQQHSFRPFNIDVDDRNLYDCIQGIKPKRTILSGYSYYEHKLNECNVNQGLSKENQFLELFSEATLKIIKNKYNI